MRDPPGPPSLGEDSIVEGCPTGLCQICDRLRGIPDHSGSLQRMRPSQGSLATANSYAHLHEPWSRTENPGVGGSIPSQPTSFQLLGGQETVTRLSPLALTAASFFAAS